MQIVKGLIEENNRHFNKDNVKRIIILYEMDFFFIGDTCRVFSYLRLIHAFFDNKALIDVNINNHHARCYPILKDNKHIHQLTNERWVKIDFNNYDLVICLCTGERVLMDMWENRYADGFRPAVFSYSVFFGYTNEALFPSESSLNDYLRDEEPLLQPSPELFLSDEERQWGNDWLEKNGVAPHEKVIVFIDEASIAEKVLPFWVKFQLMNYFFGIPDVRILIFDERAANKRDNYKKYLSPANFNKLIIAERLEMRRELTLLAGSRVKMIFGPCTGFMHCSSGIYKTFMNEGMPAEDVPLMLVYGGFEAGPKSGNNNNKWFWWQYSLVDCMAVRKKGTESCIVPISIDYPEVEYACTEYTAAMIIDYINTRYSEKLMYLGLTKSKRNAGNVII